jgi:hypothetical protein
MSQPMNRRLSLAAATPVVPLPMQGSQTRSLGWVNLSMSHSNGLIGC